MATVSRRNLVKDPRFAVLPTVWETGTPSFSTTHVRPDRTKAVKVDFPTDATSYPTVWGTDVFTITSGQTLHIGAWVYEDDDAGQVVIVRDAPYQEWTHNTVRGWNWITRSFTGAMTSELYFGVRYYGGYSLWFSDPIAEIRTTVLSSSDYFDALFPTETRVEDNATRSYGWEGTANNSPSLQYDWELPADVPTTLADPTVVQTSCSGDDQVAPTLTRPANTSSVVYTQTGNVVAGGSTVVTATAQTGYILPTSSAGWVIAGNRKTATWTISWTNPVCTVATTLNNPTVVQTSCSGATQVAPSITRPSDTSSVVYTQSGAVAAGGSTVVTATAQPGYILPVSQTGWVIASNRKTATYAITWLNPICTVPDVETTLSDPTVVQTSCSGDNQVAPTLTRPSNTSSVVYTQTGNVVAGGSTTVTATAQAGYILPASRVGWTIAGNRKTATWVISWANPSCTVTTTLTDPTIAQTSCFGGSQIAPTLTRPTNTSSVVYTQSGNVVAGGTTTITATAQTGYILPASQTDWIIAGNRKTATWVVFWANPNCTVPDATVYPEDPLVLQPYCVGSTLIPPSISKPVNTMSIVYTQSGSVLPGGSTTVTATAQSGYVFPSSVPGWTATGSNKVLNFVVYWSNPNCEVLGEMIVWNRPEDQIFEIGIDRGVLYVGSLAVPWNGLTDVTIKQEGGDIKSFYMDGVKRQTRVIPTDFAADINAFTAPALFRSCDGFNEINTGFVVDNAPRKPFGLAYRSLVGNGIKGKNFAYKIHLIYNAFASSGDKVNTSISDSSDPETYSWTLTATPDRSIDGNYGAHYILDSREVPLAKLSQIETILYGTVSIAPRLPLPSEIDTIIG